MDEIKKETEELVEAAETVKAAAEEAAEETVEVVEEVTEAGTDLAAEATENVEAVEEVTEAGIDLAAEATETVEAAAEEAVEETVEVVEEVTETEEKLKPATEEVKAPVPQQKKQKEKLGKSAKVSIIVGIIVVVIVLACLAFAGIKMGWFGGNKSGSKVELGDYSEIEVLKSNVEVSDETVEAYITQVLSSQQTTETVTEGKVALGDTVIIDYEGTFADSGEAFSGGTAQDQQLTIGSGAFIPGFEDGLVDKEIGSTVNIPLTFPEDYGNTEMAGKDVNFKVTIDSKINVIIPELTDEFVQQYSYNSLPKQLNTVAELKEYMADYIYHYYLHDAMMSDIQRKAKVVAYDEKEEADLMAYSAKSLDYYATTYGLDAETYAQAMGYASAEEYEKEEAHYYLDIIMVLDKIVKEKKIKLTDEGLDQCIVEYMGRSGYNQYYDLDEFKAQSGEDWLFLFENLEYKYNVVLEALEPNVTLVDELSEVPTEAETEETTTAAAK